MTKGDGKPCKKCGTSEWYASGMCVQCTKEASRQWARNNPEMNTQKTRRWQKSNPEKRAAADSRWSKENPERKAVKASKRRTAKTQAGGSYTVAEFNALVEHYGGKCLCCGRSDVRLTADHVVPVAKGGSSDIDNIQPLCGSCNSRKNAKVIDYRPGTGLGRWIQRKLFG